MDQPERKFAFISYTSSDEVVVGEIVKRLRRTRFDVWTFRDEYGGEYQQEIPGRIKKSAALVLMASSNSEKSKDVRAEVKIANDYGIPIIKVELDRGGRSAHEYVTTTLAAVVLHGGADDPQFLKLVEAVSTYVPKSSARSTQNLDNSILGWLRPHLVNRTAQEDTVGDLAQRTTARGFYLPGLFLLQGRQSDCPDSFVHRLAQHTLPQKFGRLASHGPARLTRIDWPRRRSEDDDVSIRLRDLTGAIDRARDAAINDKTWALVVDLELPLDDWTATDHTILRKLVNEWQKPGADVETPIPVVIVIRVCSGNSLFERIRRKPTLFQISVQFKTSERGDTEPARHLGRLPRLNTIRFTEASTWVHNNITDLPVQDPDENIRIIRRSFSKPAGLGMRRLSMDKAVAALKQLMEHREVRETVRVSGER